MLPRCRPLLRVSFYTTSTSSRPIRPRTRPKAHSNSSSYRSLSILRDKWEQIISSSSTLETSKSSKQEPAQSHVDVNSQSLVVDCLPKKSSAVNSAGEGSPSSTTSSYTDYKRRLPRLSNIRYQEEFSPSVNYYNQKGLATARILQMALQRVLEPPTLHLLAASGCTVMAIGMVEGSLLCQLWPWDDPSGNTGLFILRYSLEQIFPSVVWMSQDPNLVAHSLGLEPSQILQELAGENVYSANVLLFTTLLSTSRYFFAGFMMIAQLIRAANVSVGTFSEYEDRIQLGREPPLVTNQLVVRFCGRDSHVSELSLKRMGVHFFPVFEEPQRVQFLVWKHSERKRRPVYWGVSPGLYGSLYSWDRFPADASCFLPGIHNPDEKILVLEADATNANDPLTIGEKAMDLTLEDASQGFRRILERYSAQGLIRGKDFRTLRVYLGNSMETATSGGGHMYTLRHRIHYAKEIDVLIDSRAPVLYKILEWCESVTHGRERKIFFQTSSRAYFLNLQKLLKEYGYEIYDPLDLRMLSKMREEILQESEHADTKTQLEQESSLVKALLGDPIVQEEDWDDHRDFLEQFSNQNTTKDKSKSKSTDNDESGDSSKETSKSSKDKDKDKNSKSAMLRKVARMSKLPRLIHMKTTAETVNAFDALIMAGEVDAGNCCALIDREEGVTSLEQTLKQKDDFIQDEDKVWMRKSVKKRLEEKQKENDTNSRVGSAGLQIICSSNIHDDVLRQVRLWARYGYSTAEIQREMDAQYHEILTKSFAVQRQISSTSSDSKKDDNHKDEGGTHEEAENGAPEVAPETTPDELTTATSESSSTKGEEESKK